MRVAGIASCFSSLIDAAAGPTRIMRGAFLKSIMEHLDGFPMLWQHITFVPLGIATVRETSLGLEFEGALSEIQVARDCFTLITDQVIRTVSIGFDVVRSHWVSDRSIGANVRLIDELDLYEISPVTFAADPGTSISQLNDNDSIWSAYLVDRELAEMERIARRRGYIS